jgi:hypothetical protein
MAYNLYKRNVQVQILKRNDKAPALLSRGAELLSIPSDPFNDTLKIDFNVGQLSNSQSNSNYIELYNLNDKTQSFIKDLDVEVSLLVGYGNKLSLVFKGNITKVEITRKNNDMVTKLYLGNQVDLITQAYFSKTYQGLIPIKTILTDAVATFKMPYINFDLIPDVNLINFTWDGRTKDLFDFILKPLKLQWYNDKGIINITLLGKPNEDTTFLITPDNGLIDYPVKTDKGVNINVLFNAQINSSSLIELKLDANTTTLDGRRTNLFVQELNGKYKVMNVVYKGSSYDGDMLTSLECASVESQ